jgi:hypothetical protein
LGSHLAATYVPRQPSETVLHKLVEEHLEDFLQRARDNYAGPLPKYVEREFRGFPSCGDFSKGFAHVHCTSCDHEMLVAFSCQNRGVCPSSAGQDSREPRAASRPTTRRVIPSSTS